MEDIEVYSSYTGKDVLIGILHSDISKGKQIYSFEYVDSYLKNNSNIMLDPDLFNGRGRQFVPEEKSIFGFLSDCAPDRWGRMLLKRKRRILFPQEKQKELYELDFILGVNDEARIGDIRFKYKNGKTFLNADENFAIPPLESLRRLEEASLELEKADETFAKQWIEILLKPGSSLGGARPKATMKDVDGSLWIAKFPSKHDEIDSGAWEMVVNKLGVLCGLDVPNVALKKFTPLGSTFLSKRFDRVYKNTSIKRVHYASSMTLLGKIDGSSDTSYLDILELIKSLSFSPQKDAKELWKRLLFNVLISNTDDHLRNHGFLLDEKGWHLSPLFDVNPNPLSSKLTLNITEDDNSKDAKLALETSRYYFLTLENAKQIYSEMNEIIKRNWLSTAKMCGISKAEIDFMASSFSS